ncbi:hypothetical protein ACFX2I_023948 [Malus domestica]
MAPPIPFDQKPSEPNFHGALFSNLPIFWHILIHLIKELHKDSLNFSVSSSLSIKTCSGNNIHLINKDDGRSILLGKTENITNQGLDREEEDDDELELNDSLSDGEPIVSLNLKLSFHGALTIFIFQALLPPLQIPALILKGVREQKQDAVVAKLRL